MTLRLSHSRDHLVGQEGALMDIGHPLTSQLLTTPDPVLLDLCTLGESYHSYDSQTVSLTGSQAAGVIDGH